MSTTSQTRDFLGHPCKLTEAYDDTADEVVQIRAQYPADSDPRGLPRAVGASLRRLRERIMRLTEALEAIRSEVPDDSGGSHALLSMAGEYSTATESQFHDLTAMILVTLERNAGYPDHLKPGAEGGAP